MQTSCRFLMVPLEVSLNTYFIKHKKGLNKFSLWTWCTKKPFCYRVVHHMLLQFLIKLKCSSIS